MTHAGATAAVGQAIDWQPPADGLIGRDEELSRFAAILRRGGPALVLLSGDIGVGKSNLLLQLRAQVGAQPGGWTIIPSTASDELSVDASTTEPAFEQRIAPVTGAGQLITQSALAQRPAGLAVAYLRGRAPVLLVIDGYRPSGRFAGWFSERFVPDVRQAGANVVIVVSAAPREAAAVAPLADERIELHPLDPAVVRQHFTNIGLRLSPPMAAAELDEYVQAACQRSDLIRSLTRVLWLAQLAQ
jgi:hypothetical protein